MDCYYHFQDLKKVSRCLFVDILKILLKISILFLFGMYILLGLVVLLLVAYTTTRSCY